MAWAKLRPSNAVAMILMGTVFTLNLRAGEYLKFDWKLLPENQERMQKAAEKVKTVLAQSATGCVSQKPFNLEQYAQVRGLLKAGKARTELEKVLGTGCGIELDKFSWTAINGKKLIVQFDPQGILKKYTFDSREISSDV